MRWFAVVVVGLSLFACAPRVDLIVDGGQIVDGGPSVPDAGTCERVDFQTNPNHCGACNQACAYRESAFASCVIGVCQYACLPGFGDCDSNLQLAAGNGCEAKLSTNANHCGSCGKLCTDTRPNAMAACTNGTCRARCDPLYGDCNFDLKSPTGDGCETDLRSTANSCGECGKVCSTTCTSGACFGDLAECRLFSSQSPRIYNLAIASDGTNTALAWWDFDNDGLWVALVGPRGQSLSAPRRLLGMPTPIRPALSFDGTSFVLAWATSTVPGMTLQRLSRAQLVDEGTPVHLAFATTPAAIYGASRAGRAAFMGWNNTLQSVTVVIWRHGQAQPDAPRVVSIPGTPESAVTGFASVRDGFVLAWVARQASPQPGVPPEKRLGTLRLALDGTPGASSIDPSPLSFYLHNGVHISSMGDRAMLIGVEGHQNNLRSLVLDETGTPLGSAGQFAWNLLVSQTEGERMVGGDPSGAWLLESARQVSPGLRARRLSPAGQTVGIPKMIFAGLGPPYLQITSFGSAGALVLWTRSVSTPDFISVLGTAFIDASGMVNTACATP